MDRRLLHTGRAARKQLARDLVLEVRGVDARLAAIAKRMSATLAEHGSRLPDVAGIGPVLAARIVGRTGTATCFPSAASYAGVALIEVSIGDRARHRLSPAGDRQLNCALHLVAVTQTRMPASRGRVYYDTKRAAGKTQNEAMRCLKHRSRDLLPPPHRPKESCSHHLTIYRNVPGRFNIYGFALRERDLPFHTQRNLGTHVRLPGALSR